MNLKMKTHEKVMEKMSLKMEKHEKQRPNEPEVYIMKMMKQHEATHGVETKWQELELARKQSQIICPSVEMAPVIRTSSWFAGCSTIS